MKPKDATRSVIVLALSFALFAMVLIGCESSSDSESSGSLQISNLTVSPSSITVGSTSIIEATVTNGGSPLSNRVVVFSVDPTYGSCTPAEDTTDQDGVAATIFSSVQSGTVQITVHIKEAENITRSVSIEVTSETQGSGNIDITALPATLLANGLDTCRVTVTVKDAAGSPAPDSTVVKLAAGERFDDIDGNGYFTSGVDSVIYDVIDNDVWDAVGTIPAAILTAGGGGQAETTFVSGVETGTFYIRATVTASGYSGYVEIPVELRPDAAIASIVIVSDSIHLAVKGTGGLETAILRAIGYDWSGNRVPEGMQISFIITDGPSPIPGDPLASDDDEHLGNLTGDSRRGPYVATTNAMGIASCPISSGMKSGTIRVRAYADTIMSTATLVMVHAGPPYRIVVASEECNVQYWGWVNQTVQVTSLVSDVYNNPCTDSTVVYFTCDEGVIKAHEARIQGENGLASTVWMSYGADTAADGWVVLYAETNGGDLIDSSAFINSWVPDTIWFVVFPGALYANGKANGFMYAEVRDLNGNYVLDCDKIKLESEFVSFTDRENGDGCFGSGVGANIQSAPLDMDYSVNLSVNVDDDGIGAVDYVTARYSYLASATMPCTLLTGTAYRDNCELDFDNTTAEYSSRVYFTASIKDRWANPLGNHTLVASATNDATIVGGGTKDTDEYGQAEYAVDMPANTTGHSQVTITVSDIDPRGGITLTQDITIPVNPILTVAPVNLDFGSAQTDLPFNISNGGSGTITWTISTDRAWLTTDQLSGTTITETDQIQATVNRAGLSSGDYTGSINISSDAGNVIVAVTMTVP
jgi:hypothetical protein